MKANLFFRFLILFFSASSLYAMEEENSPIFSRKTQLDSTFIIENRGNILSSIQDLSVFNEEILDEDDYQTELLILSDEETPIDRYIRKPSDSFGKTKTIMLSPVIPSKPLIVHENAEFDFGKRVPIPVTDNYDHDLHYFVGAIDKAANEATQAKFINFLLLGLDAVYVAKDVNDIFILKRKTIPILFNRHDQRLTINPANEAETCVFLSYSKRRKSNHKKIISLSAQNGFNVNFREKTHKVYFHPANIFTSLVEKEFMYERFPQLESDKNYDSEVNGAYMLLQNQGLISDFLQALENPTEILSVGLRYYSFLDMCERCQRFLENNQQVFKPLFMQTLSQHPLFQANQIVPNVPFTVVAHSNRIYQDNKYRIGDDLARFVEKADYPYAVSGPKRSILLEQFPRYAGKIIPVTTPINRLVALIHEPDLGEEDELGIVRQHFAGINEPDFSYRQLKDKQANTLAAKLERADSSKITKINLSNNSFGMEEPELADDPTPLTNATELVRVFKFISQCVHLQELRIGRNQLSSFDAFTSLWRTLPTLTNLRVLELNDVGLGADANLRHIIEDAIINLTLLETLDLNDNFIYYEGAQALARLLKNLHQLKNLHVAYGALCHRDGRKRIDDPYIDSLIYDPEGFFDLAHALSMHPNINFIDISYYNKIRQHRDKEQIKSPDRDRFIQIVQERKPNVTINSTATPFKSSY